MPFRSSHRRDLALALLVAAAAAPAWAAGVTVRLHAAASVARDAVTLGDVAEIDGADRERVDRLRGLPLGRVARRGTSVALRRGDIARWACMKQGVCGQDVTWSGARRVEVRGTAPVASRAALVEVARQALESALAPLGASVSIEAMKGPDGVEVPAGDVVFSARPLPAGTAPSRHMTVWVDARVDGRFVRAVPVQLKVAATVPAWVARDDIPAGARVSAAAFLPGEADLAVAPGEQPRRRAETFTDPDDVLLVRHALRPGQPLTAANSGPVPLVARGDTALLRMKSSLIELESRVDVLQDGYLGQTVRVRAGNAGGIVTARVTGAGLLETQN